LTVTLSAEQRADLDYHASNLSAPTTTLQNRTRAAQMLVRMEVPQAADALETALRSGVPDQVAAVVRAVEIEPNVPISLADALIEVVPESTDTDAKRARLRAIGVVFSDWQESGADLLSEVLENGDRTADDRIAAARVIGEVRGPVAAARCVQSLMAVIDPGRSEPEALREVAFAALARVTGIGEYGSDAAQWLQWWETTRDTPPEEWLPNQMDRLNERIGSLSRDLRDEKARTTLYQNRLEQVMTRLYLELAKGTEQEMFSQLAAWIRDDFAPVRRIAIARADSRVANGQPLSPEVHAALAERVASDTEADLRRRAARTLDRQNYAGLGELVAAALRAEEPPESALVYLDILERRPVPSAAEPVIGLVASERLRDAACGTARALHAGGMLDEHALSQLRDELRRIPDQGLTPPVALLIGAVGAEGDAGRLVPLLDSADPAVRVAAARALRRHSFAHDALISRASDPAVYPTVLAIDADDAEPTREAIDRLMRRAPSDESLCNEWWNALIRLGARLPPALLGHMDDRIAATPDATLAPRRRAEARTAILGRVTTMPSDAIAPDVRRGLLLTLAEQALLTADPNLAVSALDRIHLNGNGNGNSRENGNGGAAGNGDPATRETRCRLTALLHLREWDKALAVDPAPAAWIAAAEAIAGVDAAKAATAAAQIAERFSNLSDEQRSRVERLASGHLPAVVEDPENGDSTGAGGG